LDSTLLLHRVRLVPPSRLHAHLPFNAAPAQRSRSRDLTEGSKRSAPG
jgi:hypothetical protein